MTDAASIDSDLNKQDELSREEILKQIFGDIGELIDGDDNDVTVWYYKDIFIFLISWFDDILFVTIYNNITYGLFICVIWYKHYVYVDFTCAVESTVLLHGRMYITSKFICFYSNLFGLEKKIRIPYSHIRSITKTMTAMVIPNAISISTGQNVLYCICIV